MAFSFATMAEHEYVIPLDAARLIAAGRLDRRLFDVLALARLGYDGRGTLPLIVTRAQGAPIRYAPAKTGLAAYWHQITDGSLSPATLVGGPNFVSLRAKLTFGDGSTLDQAIIHAYRLRT